MIVVLAVAAMGVAARRDSGLDAGTADGLWKGVRPLAAILAAIALVVVIARFAKHRDDGYGLLRRAGTATAWLLAAAAVLTPIGLLFFGRQSAPKQMPGGFEQVSRSSQSMPDRPDRPVATGHGVKGPPFPDYIVRTILYLILGAAIVLIAYGAIRLLRRHWFSRAQAPVVIFEELDRDVEQLTEAIAAGSRALDEGDAREAVIACYAAMENALSAEGNGRRAADTPEEFLRRVTGARLIPAAPAERLTDLFREARFSRHPVDEAKREQARQALNAIAEHLRARAAEALAAAEARVSAAAAAAGSGAEGRR
ncbi:MAG: DUF4129 domain-containing protein [Catenulisporales bacterium]|nr:DUF4129 domain-containing protein [Catenulisporales bacterium]